MENQKTRPVCCFFISTPQQKQSFSFFKGAFCLFFAQFSIFVYFRKHFFFLFEKIPCTPWPCVVHIPYASTGHRERAHNQQLHQQQQTKRRVAICEPVPSDYTPFRWLVCLVWLVGWLVGSHLILCSLIRSTE